MQQDRKKRSHQASWFCRISRYLLPPSVSLKADRHVLNNYTQQQNDNNINTKTGCRSSCRNHEDGQHIWFNNESTMNPYSINPLISLFQLYNNIVRIKLIDCKKKFKKNIKSQNKKPRLCKTMMHVLWILHNTHIHHSLSRGRRRWIFRRATRE